MSQKSHLLYRYHPRDIGSGTDYGYFGGSIHGNEYSWSLDVTYTYGQAVISGETVFAYLSQDTHN